MALPDTYLGQYFYVVSKAEWKTPYFCRSMIARSTQKPLSNLTTFLVLNINSETHRSNAPTLSILLSWGLIDLSLWLSFSSTISIVYRIPRCPQHMIWFSIPYGWGFWGQKTYLVQVNLLIHMDIDLSKQGSHDGLKFWVIWWFYTTIILCTNQNLSFQQIFSCFQWLTQDHP